jgi:hypothetical protein
MELEQSLLHSIPDQLKRRKSSIFFQVLTGYLLRIIPAKIKVARIKRKNGKKSITFITYWKQVVLQKSNEINNKHFYQNAKQK